MKKKSIHGIVMGMLESAEERVPSINLVEDGVVCCQGPWTIPHLTELESMMTRMAWPLESKLTWDVLNITAMDTGGAVVLHRTMTQLRNEGRQVSVEGLRPEFEELLQVVAANWDRVSDLEPSLEGYRQRLEQWGSRQAQQAVKALEFLGECTVTVLESLKRPSLIRKQALIHSLEQDGFHALPITGLLAFLLGFVIAYQGAEQLRQFGANIFVVDLVGISLLREIAPLIVAILIAGRSGSAYAAEIGAMKVTEELDAVKTLGLSPMQLLVVPRVCALVIAVPLLTVYADVLGVMGGSIIASNQLNVSFTEFVSRFEETVAIRHFFIGIGKAPFFAIIIALVGCYQGFQIRGSVDDVGRRTTISVVQSIFLVIVFDAFCSIVLSWWDI